MNYGDYTYDDSQRTLDSAFSNLSFHKNEKKKNNNNNNNNNTGIINNENRALNNHSSHININNDIVKTGHNKNNNRSINTDDKIKIISVPSNTFSYLNTTSTTATAITTTTNDNRNNSNSGSDANNPYNPSITYNNKNRNATENDTVNSLKIDLQIKESQIQALENEIQLYKKLINDDLKSYQGTNKLNNNNNLNGYSNNSLLDSIEEDENDEDTLNKIIIPENVETILYTLSTKLKETQEKLKMTEDHLESVLCAIALNPSNSITKDGRYDIETIAHKMIVRLEILTKENKEMAKMLSYGKSKEISIELNLARRENAELKEKIKVLEDKISSLSHK